MATGTLSAESLKLNVPLAVALEVHKLSRVGPLRGVAGRQPAVWTFVEFGVPDDGAPALADALAAALDPEPGWYCDFRTERETFVVFAGRVFRYARGDAAGRGRTKFVRSPQ